MDGGEESELKQMLDRGEVPHIYKTKIIVSGDVVEVEVYPVFMHREDVPRLRVNKTRRAQRNLNERNARKRLTRLLNANFGEHDFWRTFTYEDDSLSMEEAEHAFKNFVKRINYHRKREDYLMQGGYVCMR